MSSAADFPADGTAWMGFYRLSMLSVALELALEKPAYEDIASKFFEHYVSIYPLVVQGSCRPSLHLPPWRSCQ